MVPGAGDETRSQALNVEQAASLGNLQPWGNAGTGLASNMFLPLKAHTEIIPMYMNLPYGGSKERAAHALAAIYNGCV